MKDDITPICGCMRAWIDWYAFNWKILWRIGNSERKKKFGRFPNQLGYCKLNSLVKILIHEAYQKIITLYFPVDTGRNLNVLYTFNLHPVSTGLYALMFCHKCFIITFLYCCKVSLPWLQSFMCYKYQILYFYKKC